MTAQQKEDVIRQIASSSEYSAHGLRVMNQPRRHDPELVNTIDTHSDDAIHATQDDVGRLIKESTRIRLNRIERVNASFNASLHAMNNDLHSCFSYVQCTLNKRSTFSYRG